MTEPLNPTTLFKCLADDTRAKISLLVVSEGVNRPGFRRHLFALN